ncbi:hypothetical protein C8R46DRAFT_202286 [Mycena filopes]|nr:hypothetical protein C8R46DRAFT_202286 [Mycena filopes]
MCEGVKYKERTRGWETDPARKGCVMYGQSPQQVRVGVLDIPTSQHPQTSRCSLPALSQPPSSVPRRPVPAPALHLELFIECGSWKGCSSKTTQRTGCSAIYSRKKTTTCSCWPGVATLVYSRSLCPANISPRLPTARKFKNDGLDYVRRVREKVTFDAVRGSQKIQFNVSSAVRCEIERGQFFSSSSTRNSCLQRKTTASMPLGGRVLLLAI